MVSKYGACQGRALSVVTSSLWPLGGCQAGYHLLAPCASASPALLRLPCHQREQARMFSFMNMRA